MKHVEINLPNALAGIRQIAQSTSTGELMEGYLRKAYKMIAEVSDSGNRIHSSWSITLSHLSLSASKDHEEGWEAHDSFSCRAQNGI